MNVASDERAIAWDRTETAECERGTYGCAVNHSSEGDPDSPCEGW